MQNIVGNLLDRITINPEQCGGRPCISGMRIRVTDVLDLFAAGLTSEQILQEMPDLENEDLTFKTGTGVFFLTQYSQDVLPSPMHNEELTCNFRGLTNDGKYYVAARLAITHPSLPKGIDFTDTTNLDQKLKYLKKDEHRLNSFSEDSFKPSLKNLKSLIVSISTK